MVAVGVLLSIAMIMMYSISPVLSYKLLGSTSRNFYFYGQLFSTIVALIIGVVASKIYFPNWKRWSVFLLIVTIVALAVVMLPGLGFTKNGATRWIRLGPASFQPAELLKLSIVIYLAAWFEARRDQMANWREVLVPFSLMLGAAGFVIVVMQRDMGTMMVVAASMIALYFIAGSPMRQFAALVAASFAVGVAAIVAFPHRMERLLVFLDPAKDLTDTGYHINQALIAIGSGGIIGRGLGHSYQIYGYLPEAANDSIFAVIGEEFGLLGAIVIIALYVVIVQRGLLIAKGAPDVFSRLLAIGITVWLGFQAIVNIAAMLSLIPLTGIPLPFISYGGSSLVLSLIGIGILLNISKYTNLTYSNRERTHANSSERRRVRRPHLANSGNAR
jgi:cell division protein FtsW